MTLIFTVRVVIDLEPVPGTLSASWEKTDPCTQTIMPRGGLSVTTPTTDMFWGGGRKPTQTQGELAKTPVQG